MFIRFFFFLTIKKITKAIKAMMRTPARAIPTISPVRLPESGDVDGGPLFGEAPLGFGGETGSERVGEGCFGHEPAGAGGGVKWEPGEGGVVVEVAVAMGGEKEGGEGV